MSTDLADLAELADLADLDFSRSPRQRQRRRETGFYCALGFATALAVATVLTLSCFIEGDSARLQAGTLMLQTELQQLQPRLAQVKALEATLVTQHKQLELLVAQATQRAFAPQALYALTAISPVHIRLQQIVVRIDEAEIRGAASDQRQLQALVDALNTAGPGRVRLKEMQQEAPQETQRETRQDPHAPAGLRYSFTLILSRSVANPVPIHPPAPAPPANGEAAPVQRTKRT